MSGADSQITLQAPVAAHQGQAPTPCLTILFHPDISRVGERLRLPELIASGMVELSRTSPDFAQPQGRERRPLADRYLSRQPLGLRGDGRGGVVLTPTGVMVSVDGETLTGEHPIPAAALPGGVVLELNRRVVLLLHQVGAENRDDLPDLGMVGANDAIVNLRRNILRVADLPVPVMIRGETGTGKELAARAVHRASGRAERPFISVNMAAIPAETAASSLFGHRRGAFTGAINDHRGYFIEADRGSLFLDEIGATPPQIQPMLLRALESQEIQPLGTATPHQVDVRLIAATDADLEQAIANDSFRAALLHRLEGYQLFLPPLRNRRDDIGRLIIHFLRTELATTDDLGQLEASADAATPWISPSFVAQLARLEWPGNVRQLNNLIRQLAISSRGAAVANIDDTVARLVESATTSPATKATESAPETGGELDDDALIAALRKNDWQVNRAAAALGISRSSMYERVKRSPRVRSAKELGADEISVVLGRCSGDVVAAAQTLEVSARALKLRLKELGLTGE